MTAWSTIHAERNRLAELLEGLTPAQWGAPTLCEEWRVAEVVAHLSAGASTGAFAWIVSIVRARFDADRHNARLLARHLGEDRAATLAEYRRAAALTIAPTRDHPAFLGEAIVHGQDIARPLGLELTPDPDAVVEVAAFFADKDFAVNSRTLVRGLRLEAEDAPFARGDGDVVRGRALDLVMAMAGRPDALEALSGDGVSELRRRLA